uniref:Uncharacterized protein n=1 Tax=Glossina pallidipes TaxID=7398 RepID=A0A1A9ZNT2_GLOPL
MAMLAEYKILKRNSTCKVVKSPKGGIANSKGGITKSKGGIANLKGDPSIRKEVFQQQGNR